MSPSRPTWRELLAEATDKLRNPQEARWIAERAGGFDAAALQLALQQPAAEAAAVAFRSMLSRRAGGEPLQYVVGRWSFRSLELMVDRRVLVPRPETEQLVEATLAECDRLGAAVLVDLGTGSGAIALSIAVERPALEVWATDSSTDALAVAQLNLDALDLEVADRLHLRPGDWFEALPDELQGRVDVVVSNPPYVAETEVEDLPAEVHDWEPAEALVAGPDGLRDITTILELAPQWLARPGAVLLEMAPHQVRRAESMARSAGFTAVSILTDMAGRDRILQARL